MNQMEQYKRDHENGVHEGINVVECPQCASRTAEEAHGEGMHAGDYNSECEHCLVMQHEAEHAFEADPECELCREVADPKAPVDDDDYCNVCDGPCKYPE